MTTTLTKSEGVETLQVTLKGNEPKLSNIIMNASRYLWEHGYGDHGTDEVPIVWADLNKSQKLSMYNKHIKRVTKDLAKTYASTTAQGDARDLVDDTFDDDNEIGD